MRLYNLTEVPPGLYHDEAMNGNNALEALSIGNFKVFYPENNGREGLFINIQAIFLAIFGNQSWVLRLPSALFGILTVLGIYFLTKELFAGRLFSTGTGRSSAPAAEAALDLSASEPLASLRDQSSDASETFRTKTGGRLTYPEIIALLSSFFLATSFWHINFSRIGFRAIMAPFFLVWGIYFLLKSLNSILWMSDVHRTSDIPKLKIIFFSILAGIFYGLGFYSYIAYRATPLLILIILFLYWLKNKEPQIRKKILLSTFYFLLSTIIIAAPLGLYFLHNPQDFFGRTTQISIFNSPTPLKDLSMNILKTAGMFNFIGDWNWRHNYAGRPELFWPVGILFILGVVLSIRRLFSTGTGRLRPPAGRSGLDSRQADSDFVGDQAQPASETFRTKTGGGFFTSVFLLSWLIVAALPVVVSNEALPHALRSILLIPPVFILAGFGGIWLYEKIAEKLQKYTKIPKLLLLSIFYFLLSLFVFEAYYTYFILWAQNPNVYGAFNADYVQISRDLNNLPKELPKYVVVEASGIDVRGIPMPAQTIMFITDTFSPEKQKEKNIFYILPSQMNQIPEGSYLITLK